MSNFLAVGKSAPNTPLTITIPPNNLDHIMIEHIHIVRASTAPIVGGLVLDYTSTNLDGWRLSFGDKIIKGESITDLCETWEPPHCCTTPGMPVTITAPAAGPGVVTQITVLYAYGWAEREP